MRTGVRDWSAEISTAATQPRAGFLFTKGPRRASGEVSCQPAADRMAFPPDWYKFNACRTLPQSIRCLAIRLSPVAERKFVSTRCGSSNAPPDWRRLSSREISRDHSVTGGVSSCNEGQRRFRCQPAADPVTHRRNWRGLIGRPKISANCWLAGGVSKPQRASGGSMSGIAPDQ